MLPNETFTAMRTLKLPIPKMGLYMTLNILFPAEPFFAGRVETEVFLVRGVWAGNELCDIVYRDTRFVDCLIGV